MSRATEPDFLANDELPARPQAAAPVFGLDVKRSLQMHPVLAVATASLVMLAIFAGALLLKTQYQATAIFSVSPVVTAVLPVNGAAGNTDVSQFDSTMQQDVETLQRADTAEAAVRSLPPGVWRQPNETVQAAVKRLQRSLSAARAGTSLQISATLTGAKAADTSAAMSALAAQFLKTVHRDEDGRATERIQLLKEEAARVQANLDSDRAEAAALSAEFGVARLQETDKTPLDLTVGDLRQELAELRRARAFASAGVAQQGAGGGSDEYNQNTTTSGLVAQINARKAQLQSQMAGMTTANPIYQQDVAELHSLDRELLDATERSDAEQVRRQQRTRDRAVSGVAQEEARVTQQLAQSTGFAVSKSAKLQRYSALNSEITALQSRLLAVRESISTAQLQASSPSRVVMAVAPTEASVAPSSKRRLALLGALPLGLLAGLLAAVLARRQDPRVFLAIDLEQVLGIKPMAVLTAGSETSEALAEQGMLRMAASIEAAYLKYQAKTVVFTASSPDSQVEELVYRVQGKLKDLGYSALWVSAETLLRAERDFEQMYGRGPGSGGDVRFSESTGANGKGVDGTAVQRLNWLKREYDIVLIDAPPLLSSALAEYAVRRADVTILVSESGVTTREELTTCSSLLEQLGATGIGAVLQDLYLRYASPAYKRRLQKAEELAVRPTQREPVDNAGEWQVLNAGTIDELRVPGDPAAPRTMTRMRARTARRSHMAWAETRSTPSHEPVWDEASARLVDEAAYSSTQE